MKLNPLQQEMQQMVLNAKNMNTQSNEINQNFQHLLSNAINKVNHLQKTASDMGTRFDMGDRNISLIDVMIARNKSSVAFEATIQTRNRLIDAYKELMNMPV